MSVHSPLLPPYVRAGEVVERDGIFSRPNDQAGEYRERWEQEAAENHVASAIGRGSGGDEEYATVTAKMSPLWARFPSGLEVSDILEIGSGYGRIPLYLANERELSWASYCAVDISENMLRRLVDYMGRFTSAGGIIPICVSAEALPFDDDSFDLVLSSAVFLHMGKRHVRAALAEIARVLRPGGRFLFDVSFPNARNPASAPSRLKPARFRPPHFLKYWKREEIDSAVRESGLAAKAGAFTIEPDQYALLPKNLGPLRLPLARRVNAALGAPPQFWPDRLAVSYDVYSTELLSG